MPPSTTFVGTSLIKPQCCSCMGMQRTRTGGMQSQSIFARTLTSLPSTFLAAAIATIESNMTTTSTRLSSWRYVKMQRSQGQSSSDIASGVPSRESPASANLNSLHGLRSLIPRCVREGFAEIHRQPTRVLTVWPRFTISILSTRQSSDFGCGPLNGFGSLSLSNTSLDTRSQRPIKDFALSSI